MTRKAALLLAALTFLLGGAAAILAHRIDASLYRPLIVSLLEDITGFQVRLEAVSFAPAQGLKLELRDLQILAFDPEDPPILEVTRTYVGLDWSYFFTDKLQVNALSLVNPQLAIVARPGPSLLERAWRSAHWSDSKMELALGLGLADLTISSVAVRDGVITLIDRHGPAEQRYSIDRLQFNINHLSPTRPSPVDLTGRFREVPFKASGQVGPLPHNLDPYAMPLLLNLEISPRNAESLSAGLRALPFSPRAERGYFSALLHGNLREGVQTSVWLELEQLLLTNTRGGPPLAPMDMAIRQKSTIRVDGSLPSIGLQELYFYLDDEAVIDFRGTARFLENLEFDIQAAALNAIPLAHFPLPPDFPLRGGAVEGAIRLEGAWPHGERHLTGAVDFSGAQVRLPGGGVKAMGAPLTAQLDLTTGPDQLQLGALRLANGANNVLDLSGTVQPELALKASGAWEIGGLADLFGQLGNPAAWDAEGVLRFEAEMSGTGTIADAGSGRITSERLRLGTQILENLNAPVRLVDGRLELRDLRFELAGGHAQGLVLVQLDAPLQPIYHYTLAVAGVKLERLTPSPEQTSLLGRLANVPGEHPIRLEGFAFGHASGWGVLDSQWRPTDPSSGRAHLRLEAGRVVGLDGGLFLNAPPDGQLLTSEEAELFLIGGETFITHANGALRFERFQLAANGLTLAGDGALSSQGNLNLNITATTDWNADDPPVIGRVIGNFDRLVFERQNHPF